jgi:BASS family bile acid:Na+ symporter
MPSEHTILLALQVSIVCIVFGFGLRSTVADILFLGRRPALLIRSLVAILVVMPAVAIAFTRAFDLRHPVEVVLVALAVSPVPPLLPKKTGGPGPFTTSLMAILSLLAIVTVPLWVEALGAIYDRPLGVATSRVAGIVLVSLLLPLLSGVALRWVTPAAERLVRPVSLAGMLLLVLAGIVLLLSSGGCIWAAVGDGTLVAIASFVVIGFVVGHLLGGPDPGHASVLGLASACRHPVLSLAVASVNFPGEQFAGTVLLYLLVTAVLGVGFAAWSRNRSPGEAV